jgi:hypothetical protein
MKLKYVSLIRYFVGEVLDVSLSISWKYISFRILKHLKGRMVSDPRNNKCLKNLLSYEIRKRHLLNESAKLKGAQGTKKPSSAKKEEKGRQSKVYASILRYGDTHYITQLNLFRRTK